MACGLSLATIGFYVHVDLMQNCEQARTRKKRMLSKHGTALKCTHGSRIANVPVDLLQRILEASLQDDSTIRNLVIVSGE